MCMGLTCEQVPAFGRGSLYYFSPQLEMPASHTLVSNSHTAFTAQVQCHVPHEFPQAPNNRNLSTCHIPHWVFGKYVLLLYP